MKRLAAVFLIGAVVSLLLAVGVASASVTDIFGSDHDLGSPGNPTCAVCHTPHNAQGDYLWARPPAEGLPASWALCFSCHDGSVTQVGSWMTNPGVVNHRMGDEGHGAMNHYGDGYCLACHDAHDPDWQFTKDVMGEGKPPNPDNAMVCLSCHQPPYFDPSADKNHAWQVTMSDTLPTDMVFDPDTGDFSGTRLWDTATLQEPVPQGSSGDIACLTCHAPHGAASENDTLNSMPPKEDTTSRAPICENCHQ